MIVEPVDDQLIGCESNWQRHVTRMDSNRILKVKANSHIMRRPFRATKGLDFVFPIWFTQCGRVWFTVPCHDRAVLKATSQGHGTARHNICALPSVVQRRHVGDLPAFGFLRLPRGVPRRLSEAYPLNCRTGVSDISGYHADFHEGHGIVGEWQGRDMACVN
jgi:hypothetical protein